MHTILLIMSESIVDKVTVRSGERLIQRGQIIFRNFSDWTVIGFCLLRNIYWLTIINVVKVLNGYVEATRMRTKATLVGGIKPCCYQKTKHDSCLYSFVDAALYPR